MDRRAIHRLAAAVLLLPCILLAAGAGADPEDDGGERPTAATEPLPCGEAPPGMACIPGGPFARGTDTGPDDARPMETVWLQTFYMDLHHVSNSQYRECVAAGECREAGPNYRDFDHPRQPITGVSWYDAVRYCESRGKRLPTEAQWEKAARGTDGRTYPWGDEPATCERAVIKDRRGRSCGVPQRSKQPWKGRPFDVGSRPAGIHGLFDMAGNSWDWVRDWYLPYGKCGDDCRGVEPRGPCGGDEPCGRLRRRVVRGGSWYWEAAMAATYYRRAHVPSNDPFHHFGFRCAATPKDAGALPEPR